MIEIINKEDCVGCNACMQRCPASCISMSEDEQGFLYPKVDVSKCIDCGLCEKVCPVLNQGEPRQPIKVYAARNKDKEVIKTSSSGGIFYALAESVIKDGGVVFGARFDDEWQVMHDWTDTIEGLRAFQGSKYVQSRIGTAYQQAESFLKAGRKVMFTGTPCQIKGLVLFLRKDYGDQLLRVDVICHGVPSPGVWREYLKYITRPQGESAGKNTVSVSSKGQIPKIDSISFRDKKFGWEKFGFRISTVVPEDDPNSVPASKSQKRYSEFFELFSENLYMKLFLNNLDLRSSCYKCPAKSGKSCSDISLADYWGVVSEHPASYSKEGVSLLLVYSRPTDQILLQKNLKLIESSYDKALKNNPPIKDDPVKPELSEQFWSIFEKDGIVGICKLIKIAKPELKQRIINSIKDLLRPIAYRILALRK